MQVVYLKIVHRPAFRVNYFTVRVADWVSRLFGLFLVFSGALTLLRGRSEKSKQ